MIFRTRAKYVFERRFTAKHLTMFGLFGVHLSTRRAEKREKRKTKRTKNRERPAGARSSPPQVGEEGKAVARELVREEGDLKKATDVGATEVENAINEEKKEQATGVTKDTIELGSV